MTNCQSRFANAKAPLPPMFRVAQKDLGKDPNWTWNFSKGCFINRFGTEVRPNWRKEPTCSIEEWAHQW